MMSDQFKRHPSLVHGTARAPLCMSCVSRCLRVSSLVSPSPFTSRSSSFHEMHHWRRASLVVSALRGVCQVWPVRRYPSVLSRGSSRSEYEVPLYSTLLEHFTSRPDEAVWLRAVSICLVGSGGLGADGQIERLTVLCTPTRMGVQQHVSEEYCLASTNFSSVPYFRFCSVLSLVSTMDSRRSLGVSNPPSLLHGGDNSAQEPGTVGPEAPPAENSGLKGTQEESSAKLRSRKFAAIPRPTRSRQASRTWPHRLWPLLPDCPGRDLLNALFFAPRSLSIQMICNSGTARLEMLYTVLWKRVLL